MELNFHNRIAYDLLILNLQLEELTNMTIANLFYLFFKWLIKYFYCFEDWIYVDQSPIFFIKSVILKQQMKMLWLYLIFLI